MNKTAWRELFASVADDVARRPVYSPFVPLVVNPPKEKTDEPIPANRTTDTGP